MRLEICHVRLMFESLAEFLLLRGFLYFCLFHLRELLFGRVFASVCEAQLRLCVNFYSFFETYPTKSGIEG